MKSLRKDPMRGYAAKHARSADGVGRLRTLMAPTVSRLPTAAETGPKDCNKSAVPPVWCLELKQQTLWLP